MDVLREHRLLQRIAATLGVVGTIASAFFWLLLIPLIVPFPFVYGFWAGWVVLLVLSLVWWRPHPWRAFLVPIVGSALLYVALALGQNVLGWTA